MNLYNIKFNQSPTKWNLLYDKLSPNYAYSDTVAVCYNFINWINFIHLIHNTYYVTYSIVAYNDIIYSIIE